jgi:hypothetical protein
VNLSCERAWRVKCDRTDRFDRGFDRADRDDQNDQFWSFCDRFDHATITIIIVIVDRLTSLIERLQYVNEWNNMWLLFIKKKKMILKE